LDGIGPAFRLLSVHHRAATTVDRGLDGRLSCCLGRGLRGSGRCRLEHRRDDWRRERRRMEDRDAWTGDAGHERTGLGGARAGGDERARGDETPANGQSATQRQTHGDHLVNPNPTLRSGGPPLANPSAEIIAPGHSIPATVRAGAGDWGLGVGEGTASGHASDLTHQTDNSLHRGRGGCSRRRPALSPC